MSVCTAASVNREQKGAQLVGYFLGVLFCDREQTKGAQLVGSFAAVLFWEQNERGLIIGVVLGGGFVS